MHHTLTLLSSKNKLSVGGPLQNDELLGVWSLIEMCAQAWEPWAVCPGEAAGERRAHYVV